MIFPQKVNWFILYQSADKTASILLGLASAPIFLEVWLRVNKSVKREYAVNLSVFGGFGKIGAGLFQNKKNGGVLTPPYQCCDKYPRNQIATAACGGLAMTRLRSSSYGGQAHLSPSGLRRAGRVAVAYFAEAATKAKLATAKRVVRGCDDRCFLFWFLGFWEHYNSEDCLRLLLLFSVGGDYNMIFRTANFAVYKSRML